MADPISKLRGVIRAALGLGGDPGQPPDLVRLGFYRVRVDKAASDGSTLDVTPEDKRIPPAQNVPIRVGVPGIVAIVQQGAIAAIAWLGGDPAKHYGAPVWEAGATVLKMVLNVAALHLGGESGSDGVATKKDLQALHQAISTAATAVDNSGATFKTNLLANLVTAGWSPATGDGQCGSSKVKAQRS